MLNLNCAILPAGKALAPQLASSTSNKTNNNRNRQRSPLSTQIHATATATPSNSIAAALQIRKASTADYWPISDMHCTAFYPRANGFWGPLLRIDRVLSLHVGYERQGPGVGKFLCLCATDDDAVVVAAEGSRNSSEIILEKGSLGVVLDSIIATFLPPSFQVGHVFLF